MGNDELGQAERQRWKEEVGFERDFGTDPTQEEGGLDMKDGERTRSGFSLLAGKGVTIGRS